MRPLAKISAANLIKFKKFVANRNLKIEARESLLSDCRSVDSSFSSESVHYSYPTYANSGLENNYIITHRFFGHGEYRNTKNGQKLRESLKNEPERLSIIPSLEFIGNVKEFYGNNHLNIEK